MNLHCRPLSCVSKIQSIQNCRINRKSGKFVGIRIDRRWRRFSSAMNVHQVSGYSFLVIAYIYSTNRENGQPIKGDTANGRLTCASFCPTFARILQFKLCRSGATRPRTPSVPETSVLQRPKHPEQRNPIRYPDRYRTGIDPLNPTLNFEPYLVLRSEVDRLFETVRSRHADLVRCRLGCDDCCYAVFELTPVEAAYVHAAFQSELPRAERRKALRKADRSQEQLRSLYLKTREKPISGNEMQLEIARARVECPLHHEHRCILHQHRPITCRVYGVPTVVRGKGVTCGKSGFEPGVTYPTVNLDVIQKRLLLLSRDLLVNTGRAASAELTYTMAQSLHGQIG